jgi:hypothetical protein
MTSAELRSLIAARIRTATGYPEADHLIGAEGSPRTIGALCYEVRLGASVPMSSRQRSGDSVATYVRRSIQVRVLSAGNPARRIDQWDVVEAAEQRIRRALLTNTDDGLACVENALVWEGSDEPLYLDGGAYRLSVLRFHVSHLESLE